MRASRALVVFGNVALSLQVAEGFGIGGLGVHSASTPLRSCCFPSILHSEEAGHQGRQGRAERQQVLAERLQVEAERQQVRRLDTSSTTKDITVKSAAGWKAEGMGARVLGQLVGKVVAVFAVLSLSLASPQAAEAESMKEGSKGEAITANEGSGVAKLKALLRTEKGKVALVCAGSGVAAGGVAILLLRARAPANDAASSPSRATATRASVQVKQQVAAAGQQVAAAAVQASEKGMEGSENMTSVLAEMEALVSGWREAEEASTEAQRDLVLKDPAYKASPMLSVWLSIDPFDARRSALLPLQATVDTTRNALVFADSKMTEYIRSIKSVGLQQECQALKGSAVARVAAKAAACEAKAALLLAAEEKSKAVALEARRQATQAREATQAAQRLKRREEEESAARDSTLIRLRREGRLVLEARAQSLISQDLKLKGTMTLRLDALVAANKAVKLEAQAVEEKGEGAEGAAVEEHAAPGTKDRFDRPDSNMQAASSPSSPSTPNAGVGKAAKLRRGSSVGVRPGASRTLPQPPPP